MLSGRSREGVLLLSVDLSEGRLMSDELSNDGSHAGRSPVDEWIEDELDETALWPSGRFRYEALFICLLSCRSLSGEGGPSTAGSRRSIMLGESRAFLPLDGTAEGGDLDPSLPGLLALLYSE